MKLRLVAALSAVIFLLSCKSENKKGIVEKSTPSEIAETAYDSFDIFFVIHFYNLGSRL